MIVLDHGTSVRIDADLLRVRRRRWLLVEDAVVVMDHDQLVIIIQRVEQLSRVLIIAEISIRTLQARDQIEELSHRMSTIGEETHAIHCLTPDQRTG